jgi:excisionase family DNA binding protein
VDKEKNDALIEGGRDVAMTIEEAASAAASSRSAIYRALKSKQLSGKKAGRRTVILQSALSEYLHALPAFGEDDGQA